jgi:hypothetical protein
MKLTGENRSTRGKILSQCHFVRHKSHTERSRYLRDDATLNLLSRSTCKIVAHRKYMCLKKGRLTWGTERSVHPPRFYSRHTRRDSMCARHIHTQVMYAYFCLRVEDGCWRRRQFHEKQSTFEMCGEQYGPMTSSCKCSFSPGKGKGWPVTCQAGTDGRQRYSSTHTQPRR